VIGSQLQPRAGNCQLRIERVMGMSSYYAQLWTHQLNDLHEEEETFHWHAYVRELQHSYMTLQQTHADFVVGAENTKRILSSTQACLRRLAELLLEAWKDVRRVKGEICQLLDILVKTFADMRNLKSEREELLAEKRALKDQARKAEALKLQVRWLTKQNAELVAKVLALRASSCPCVSHQTELPSGGWVHVSHI
jgi:hypothetical protein